MNAAPETGFAARPIGEIAASLPGAAAVFRRYKLDFCCGGASTLAAAAARRDAPLAEIEVALAALTPGPGDLPEATDALIRHIVARFHEVHRRELPELIALARRVERVHADNPAAPVALAALLAEMEIELEDHMAKEEQVLFPMMRSSHPLVATPIAVMRHEHDAHAAQLRALEAITQGHAPPEGACTSWRALYAGTRKLAEDLVEHMHIENNILFPRFGA
jgi:regulator of cell morphogenesis and NO signaling